MHIESKIYIAYIFRLICTISSILKLISLGVHENMDTNLSMFITSQTLSNGYDDNSLDDSIHFEILYSTPYCFGVSRNWVPKILFINTSFTTHFHYSAAIQNSSAQIYFKPLNYSFQINTASILMAYMSDRKVTYRRAHCK